MKRWEVHVMLGLIIVEFFVVLSFLLWVGSQL